MSEHNVFYAAAVWIIPLVIAIVFHEVAHGLAARAFGDPTAHEQHRLSFNPIRHVDPVGTIVLPLVLAMAHAPVFGWARPVPVDARRMRHPRRDMVLTALAGPVMNITLAAVGAVLLGIWASWAGGMPASATKFVFDNLVNFILINVFLALFNLLPIPPFDGSHVVQGILPRPLAAHYARLWKFGFLLVILLFVVLPMIAPQANLVARVVGPPADALSRFFLGIAAAIA